MLQHVSSSERLVEKNVTHIPPPRYRGSLSYLCSIPFQSLANWVNEYGALYHLAQFIKHFLYCAYFWMITILISI